MANTKVARNKQARFVGGSIRNHILVMTATGAMGLVSLFIGDLANLLFLGQLHDTEVLAAVGFASTLLFFPISAGIGLSIATGSVVSPAIGAGKRREARRLATSSLLVTAAAGLAMVVLVWPFLTPVMGWMGAHGRTQTLAVEYLRILFPTVPLVALGMTTSGIMRSAGDAKRSMFVTLSGAIINVILDPIFILVLHFGLKGAAWASVIARVCMAAVGFWGVARVHGLLQRPDWERLRVDFDKLMLVAVPAVLTNLATPCANIFVTKALAGYGDAAMAAWSVSGRVSPVAFGAIFALSSSIGPIIGQNFGARNFSRIRETVLEASKITIVFGVFGWAALAFSVPLIVSGFALTGESVPLVVFYCRWLAPMFVFLGFLFVANAVFNVLRHPHYATMFNWGRATVGTLPLIVLGARWAGAPGIFTASLAGGIVFGLAALWFSLQLVDRLAAGDAAARPQKS